MTRYGLKNTSRNSLMPCSDNSGGWWHLVPSQETKPFASAWCPIQGHCKALDHMSDRLQCDPFAMPLSFLMGCSGINSIRFLYTNTWIFWPGLMPIDSRTSLGITTWYLGETVPSSVSVCQVQFRKFLFSEQVRMATHSFKNNFIFNCFINKKPVRFDVTFSSAWITPKQFMIPVNFIQGLSM